MKQLAFFLVALAAPFWVAAQCNECTPDPTCTSDDDFPTICPEELPNGTTGIYYETFLTFYMPASVVDPGSGVEATLNTIVIAGVAGLPFGMTWQSNSPNNTYYPSQGENLGCASLCGTPILPGEYEVVITVNVEATAFGFNQSLTESFTLPLTIEQGEGSNATFNYDVLVGCGEVNSNFEAVIDGSPGVTTYEWDFGNGNTSNDAIPETQTYTEPGEYTVTLTTTIQNYSLNTVAVTQLNNNWCGDIEEPFCNCGTPFIGTCPDPYFVITDGSGVNVYTSTVFDDVETATWNNLNFLLTNPPYTITIWDADLISQDDNLGSTQFTLQTGSQGFNANGSQGTININLVVSNVFTNEETITVFPIPDATFMFDEDLQALVYDDETLETFIWSFNGDLLIEGPIDTLYLTEPGIYQCQVFNSFGCTATSEEFILCPTIELEYNADTETLSVESGFETYSWTFNGLPLSGANGPTVDASALGNYTVTITTDYGCEVTSEVFQVTVGVADHLGLTALKLWPNPATQHVSLDLPDGVWSLDVFDLSGRMVERQDALVGNTIFVYEVSHLPAGSYLFIARNGLDSRQARVMVVR